MGLVLGTIGRLDITGAIEFPALEDSIAFPSFDEFTELYSAGSFQLSSLKYKVVDGQFLSGLQLAFSNGVESPFIETEGVADDTSYSLAIPSESRVRYLSLLVHNAVHYSGVRMLDGDGNTIVSKVWAISDAAEASEWTEPHEIAEGH